MGIRKYKPMTPGRRGASVSDFAEITRTTPEKSLVRPLHGKGGRNSHGKVTTRHQGGGHKRAYRVIDFRRADKDGVPAKVAHIEYDPNRTARIALLHYADGEKRYILAPVRLTQGAAVESGPSADIKPGNNLPLRNIPTGTVVHAIELRPGGGAKIARSAGASVQLVAKDGPYAQLRMPSGEIRNVEAAEETMKQLIAECLAVACAERVGIDLDVGEGEVVALMGRNGMGKTTTVRTVSALLRPRDGAITFAGQPTRGMAIHRVARLGIGLVPEGRRCFAPLTVGTETDGSIVCPAGQTGGGHRRGP